MKLNKGDRILYNGEIYMVICMIWNTVYFRRNIDKKGDYDFTMQQVYNSGYHDWEITD